MSKIQRTVELLMKHRANQEKFDNIPEALYPQSIDDAYQVQDAVIEALNEKHRSSPCGYKVACTNKPIMELLHSDGPFSGRMLSHSTYNVDRDAEVVLPTSQFVRRVVELEFVLVVGEDLPESAQPWNAQTIKPYISEFIPGVEIVDYRYKDFTLVGANALIADNAIHAASILGEANQKWHAHDLANHGVSLLINGNMVAEGTGANVLGSPLNVMAWLGNELQRRNRRLMSGDIVTTGTACDVYYAQSGDHVTADFGKLGSVSFSFD